MRSLPTRPLIFVSAWVLLFVLGYGVVAANVGFAAHLYTLSLTLLLLLQLAWIWQATFFATGVLALHGDQRRAARTELTAKVLAAGIVVASAVLLVAMPQTLLFTGVPTVSLSLPLALAIPVASLGMFALNWVAADTVCAAERARGGGSPHVLGTFIQFIYLVFGAPFIYRRLKRLVAADGAPAAVT